MGCVGTRVAGVLSLAYEHPTATPTATYTATATAMLYTFACT